MRVLRDGWRRSSMCKPGDRNFGGVAIAARKRASGVWEEEKRVGESSPIADAFAARDHTREQKNDEEGRGGVTSALLLTRVVVVRSVPCCCSPRRPPPAPPAEVAAFESCMLTMRTERGVGLRPPEKGTGVCC